MPSILDKLAEKAGRGAVGLLILGELRRLRRTLEIGIDAYRQVNLLDPAFGQKPTGSGPRSGDAADDDELVGGSPDNPDWLRLDLLEQLAHQHHVPIDDDTDLIALGKERGWLMPDGTLASLPDGTQDTY